jgi:hypothetical protein
MTASDTRPVRCREGMNPSISSGCVADDPARYPELTGAIPSARAATGAAPFVSRLVETGVIVRLAGDSEVWPMGPECAVAAVTWTAALCQGVPYAGARKVADMTTGVTTEWLATMSCAVVAQIGVPLLLGAPGPVP